MDKELELLFTGWSYPVITAEILASHLGSSAVRRHSLIKRLFQKKILIPLKRGIYLIGPPYHQAKVHPFAIAPLLYGPSYISLESALSQHGWIPEAIYAITSVCAKRSKEFNSEVGQFLFYHTPIDSFYYGVDRSVSDHECYLIAHPWKALADLIYVRRSRWSSLAHLSADLRIEIEDMQNSDDLLLQELSKNYPSARVRYHLSMITKEYRR